MLSSKLEKQQELLEKFNYTAGEKDSTIATKQKTSPETVIPDIIQQRQEALEQKRKLEEAEKLRQEEINRQAEAIRKAEEEKRRFAAMNHAATQPILMAEAKAIVPPRPPSPPPPPKPGFFDRNPDMEKFIGENLANKIGIAILVLGIGFFVKYAIDQDWINEIGRVFIGIICGGILIGIAHRLRKTFTAFSSVLVGGGIAVLYFTIAIAFHEYQIFSQTQAFLLMAGITAFSVLLSLGYNKQELAVLSILGGFGT
ncbi:MAG: DUF2339 domain-containing protein, partial [Bacteroidetes bacterium]|nr:DUF2339 domain-containing protein [Bacteroidota bacterium]